MRNGVNLVFLAVYVCGTLLQYAHPPTVTEFPYTWVWLIAPFLYPFCLALTHTRTGFWKGFLTVVLFSVIAQAVEAVLYLFRTNGFQHRDSDTVVLLAFYLIGPLLSGAVSFPIGYLASRRLLLDRHSNH